MASGPYEGPVDPDAATAFALATNDPNPAYFEAGVVPPLFTAALIGEAHAAAENSVPPDTVRGSTSGVHAEHDVNFHRPLRPGMILRWDCSVRSCRMTPAGAMITTQTTVTDAQGTPLVSHLWSTIHIGGEIDAEAGPELPDHRFPESARANPLGAVEFQIAPDQTYRYGGVSGDRIGHSMDDEVARAEGFPGKILQGMCTFSMCGAAAVELAAAGDPERLTRLAARLAAPVRPRQTLVVELFEAGVTDDGHRVVVFEALAEGTTVIKHGRAEFGGP